MTVTTITVETTRQPGGVALHLAQQLAMPPVRVTVIVQPTVSNTGLTMLEAFLTASDVVREPLHTAVYERARGVPAVNNQKLADTLHLAVAVKGGCGLFLANDHRLSGFPHISVVVLP